MNQKEYYEYCKQLKILMFEMLQTGKSGHIGGSLSCIETLAVVYNEYLKEKNNKLIFSKGHCELAIYALFIKEKIVSEYWKTKYKLLGSKLQGHPSGHWIKELDYSPGSLGQGLSYAIGMAICGKEENYNVFVFLGDGELQEGQIWEGVLSAPGLRLNNLNVIVDCNGLQLEGKTLNTGNIEVISKMWEAAGWNTEVIENGHDIKQLTDGLRKCKNEVFPNVYFVKTVKGHGISYMENNSNYHGTSLQKSEIKQAIELL